MLAFKFKTHSLRNKLVAIAMLTTCLALLVSSLTLAAYEHHLNRQDFKNKLAVLAEVIINQAQTALSTNSYSTLQANLNTLSADSSIIRSCIYNKQQQFMVGYTRTANTCPQHWSEITTDTSLNIALHAPIYLNDQSQGVLYLEASNNNLIARSQKFLWFSGFILLVASALALLLSNGLQQIVLRPIRELNSTLRDITLKKDYSIRADANNNTELDGLIELFNSLLNTIESDNTSLKESEDRFRILTSLAPVGIFQIDAQQNLLYVNQRWRNIHQIHSPKPLLKEWFYRIHPQDLVNFQQHWQQLIQSHNSISFEFRLLDKDKKIIWVQLLAGAVHDFQGSLLGFLGTLSDITELKDAQIKMENLAFYDPLTGLANRRLFRNRLEKTIATIQRNHSSMALLFLDMDQFKRINDTLGHDAGDELLKIIAKRLCACVRESDTVSRIGGDEFTILLTDIHYTTDVVMIANKILHTLAEPIHIYDHEVLTSVSIGITLTPEDSSDANTLMKNADMAMYKAKEMGRNTYQFFSEEMNRSVLEHIELENELSEALATGQFVLTYQPKVSLFNFSLTGLEVLLRWQHPERGLIAPDRFIPIAEESGQILAIGQWVLEQACLQMGALRQEFTFLQTAKVAVNLSSRQFSDSKLLERIKSALEAAQLPANNLELEITESTLMEDVEGAIEIMQKMKQLGISIAIDDFGTGYSSLSYIKRFPIDVLKVDRSFVMDIPADQNDMAITAAVIAMAHKLNLSVVAEGVEERAQLSFLHANFCDEGQGYLFSRPLYLHQLQKFLQQYHPSTAINF